MQLIIKIFYASNQLFISPTFSNSPEMLAPWIQFFITVLDMPVPESLSSQVDDLEVQE